MTDSVRELNEQLGAVEGFCKVLYHPFYREDGWVCCKCHTWNPKLRPDCRVDRCQHARCKEECK